MNIDDNDDGRKISFKEKMINMGIAGALILVAAVCCLLLALPWGGTTFPWDSSTVVGLFVNFGSLLIIFMTLQWKLGNKASIPF